MDPNDRSARIKRVREHLRMLCRDPDLERALLDAMRLRLGLKSKSPDYRRDPDWWKS